MGPSTASSLDRPLPEQQRPKTHPVNPTLPYGALQPCGVRGQGPQPPTERDHPAQRLRSGCVACLICRLRTTC